MFIVPSPGPEFAASPDLLLMSVVLFAAVSLEDAATARHAMVSLLAMDGGFDEAAYKHCLHACILNDDTEHAHVILEMMKKEESLEWDQSMYFFTLSALNMMGAAEDAAGMIAHIDENGLFRTILEGSTGSFYVLALRACLKGGRGDLALSLLRNMQSSGYAVEGQHYTLAMRALSDGGSEEGIAAALELHDEMEGAGVPADTFSLNAAIFACSRGGMWREAISYLERCYLADDGGAKLGRAPALPRWGVDDQIDRIALGAARLPPDVATFSSAIQACGNAGEWRAAMKLFNAMILNGVKPDRILYNCLIRACGMSPGKIIHYDAGPRGGPEGERGGEHGEGSGPAAGGEPAAAAAYDVGEAGEKAETIEMILGRVMNDEDGVGVELTDELSVHVIHAYGNLGFLDKALGWFYGVMTEYGIERTSLVWAVAIGACGKDKHFVPTRLFDIRTGLQQDLQDLHASIRRGGLKSLR